MQILSYLGPSSIILTPCTIIVLRVSQTVPPFFYSLLIRSSHSKLFLHYVPVIQFCFYKLFFTNLAVTHFFQSYLDEHLIAFCSHAFRQWQNQFNCLSTSTIPPQWLLLQLFFNPFRHLSHFIMPNFFL